MKWPMALMLIFGLTGTLSVHASVWDQMQNGSLTSLKGKIESLNIGQEKVSLTIQGQTLELCRADNDQRSEEEHAVYLNQKIQTLSRAFENKREVQVAVRGPWSPCVSEIHQVD